MDQGFIQLEGGRIFFHRYGTGSKLLVALHGFGDRSAIFKRWRHNTRFTIVAVDLPFHGKSEWKRESFGKADVMEMLNIICRQEATRRFSLLGYSLGGRIALSMLPVAGVRLERLFLIAPDGVQTSWMSIPDRLPVFMRLWLKGWLQQPAPFLKLVRWLNSWGIIDPFVDRYLRYNLDTPGRRARLFNTWIATAQFTFTIQTAKEWLEKSDVPTLVIAGRKDPLISVDALQNTFQGLENVKFYTSEKGHLLIDEEILTLITSTEF